jgi:hypothetical protein
MALQMFKSAKAYYEAEYLYEVEWANSITPETFINLKSKRFLSEYCWVIYASGFIVSTYLLELQENIYPEDGSKGVQGDERGTIASKEGDIVQMVCKTIIRI